MDVRERVERRLAHQEHVHQLAVVGDEARCSEWRRVSGRATRRIADREREHAVPPATRAVASAANGRKSVPRHSRPPLALHHRLPPQTARPTMIAAIADPIRARRMRVDVRRLSGRKRAPRIAAPTMLVSPTARKSPSAASTPPRAASTCRAARWRARRPGRWRCRGLAYHRRRPSRGRTSAP